MSAPTGTHSRPTLEEEKRRDLVLGCLSEYGVSRYDPDVVDTLARWLAQESKAAVQDKRGELSAKGIPTEAVSKLVVDCLGIDSSQVKSRVMEDVDSRIRETLIKKLSESTHLSFRSSEEIDQAVSLIRQRYEKLLAMCARMSPSDGVTSDSVEYLKDWLAQERKSSAATEQVFPQNSVPLIGFVPPTCSNGLCALPHRVDCLSGSVVNFPDHELESDLMMTEAFVESLPISIAQEASIPSDFVSVKRMKMSSDHNPFLLGLTAGIALAASAYMASEAIDLKAIGRRLSSIRRHVPADANEECPGVGSEQAGKASSCEGCPNQTKCASGEKPEDDPSVALVARRLENVKHKILVLSGKGGVGKSTVSAQLTFGLAADETSTVGLLDVDICGPSIPRMLGVSGRDVHQTADGWSPVYVDEQISVMSVGFMLPDQDSAVIWRGPKKHALIKQFLADVNWGNLDFLVCDTPPGTSDEHLSVVTLLKDAGIDGAVLVTTPQEVSLQDVRKEISFCRKVGIPIIGLIENMSGFVCPSCSHATDIFTPTTGGAEAMCAKMDIEFLGRLPLSGSVTQAGDKGSSVVVDIPQLKDIVEKVRNKLNRI